jgi:hypothetical protein
MARRIQYSFFPELKPTMEFGGELRLGKRKERRPIAVKRPMHTVMRTSYSLSSHRKLIVEAIQKQAKLFEVNVYKLSVNSNHIHLATRAKYRLGFQKFLCGVSARIAQLVTGAKKGKPLSKQFWLLIPFTRIAECWKAFKIVVDYVEQNVQESTGAIPYKPRKRKNNSS